MRTTGRQPGHAHELRSLVSAPRSRPRPSASAMRALEGLLDSNIYERIQGIRPNLTSCPLTHLPTLAAA